MLLITTAAAGTRSVKPAVCNRVNMQLVSAKPGVVGPHNLLPHTGQHAAGLCNQAMANCMCMFSNKSSNLIKELLLFECVCVCSITVLSAHTVWMSHTTSAST